MNPVSIAGIDHLNVLVHVAKISGKDGWGNLEVGTHTGKMEEWLEV